MAPFEIGVPVNRRNGASTHRPSAAHAPPPYELVPPSPPGLMSGVPRWVCRTTTTAVVLVALVAAVASYEHIRALADIAGEDWRSWLLPISVDGLAVAATMTMLVRRRAGQPAGALAWAALILGVGVSLGANVAAADPTWQGRVVAAWPPIGLLLSYELLMQQIRPTTGSQLVRSAPANPSLEVW
jgi:Protein of unknown function (DUF2637)